MEEIKALRLKERILGIELKSIQEQICAIQAQIQAYEETSSLKATTVSSVQEKTESIPECPAPGKESPNPVKASTLLKGIIGNEHQHPLQGKSSKLVFMAPEPEKVKATKEGLSQNDVNSDLRPDYLRAATSDNYYYAVYGSPHQGVHTEWSKVAEICKQFKVTCKKYRTKEQAQNSVLLYQKDCKDPTIFLRPLSRPSKVKTEKKSAPEFIFEQTDFNQSISFNEFRAIWAKARFSDLEDGVNERFYTDDKSTKSLFTFVENAEPNLVHTAFRAGLARLIYPSANLQELKMFPKEFVKAIKNFRKKVLNAKDAQIYIKIFSTIPDWEQQVQFEPYHFVQIGIAKTKKELPSTRACKEESFPSMEALTKIRATCLKVIVDKIGEIQHDSQVKINYSTDSCIISSKSPKKINTDEIQLVSIFESRLVKVEQLRCGPHTKKQWCKIVRNTFNEHLCLYCKEESSGPSTMGDSCPDSPLTNAYDERNDAIPIIGGI